MRLKAKVTSVTFHVVAWVHSVRCLARTGSYGSRSEFPSSLAESWSNRQGRFKIVPPILKGLSPSNWFSVFFLLNIVFFHYS